MRGRAVSCAAAALLAATVAAAAERPWQVEAGAGAEYLTSNGQQWTQEDLALRSRFAPRSVAEINARHTRRYAQGDDELGAGIALPLGTDWLLAAAATTSPTHRVLAKASGSMDLGYSLAGGWVVSGGLARSLFETDDSGASGSSTLRLNGERYMGAWRLALGFSRSRLDGGSAENGGRVQADHYFSERGRVGIVAGIGRELENVPDLQGVVSTRVSSVALLGVSPLSPDWALTWALGSTRNSDAMVRTGPNVGRPVGVAYRRNAVHVGVQREF